MKNKWLFSEGNKTFFMINNEHTGNDVGGIVTIFYGPVE